MNPDVFFTQLILKAIKLKSTDLHLTFRDDDFRCEMRTLNGLITIKNTHLERSLLEYIKYIAKLDLLRNYKPQTGYCKIKLGNNTIQLRVAHIKNNVVESVVIRIMNPPSYLTLETLFRREDIDRIKYQLQRDSGLILISGSTGSGKTTTLYAILNAYQNQKIYTIEDPIEAYHDDLVQLQVNETQGLSFNNALKQVLRHDPNIIVIGEIRDDEEAKAALRCALTGHLVFSTIHSNSADKTLNRLENLGLTRTEIESVLNMVIHQTLLIEEHKRRMTYELRLY